MTSHAMSDARANLAALLDAVERGEDVVITRNGRPAARLVPPVPTFERSADLMRAAGQLVVELDRSRAEPIRAARTGESPSADELVAALRSDRDAW